MYLLFKLALRNLKRHLRKSILLGSLIMIGIAVLFLANSIFQGTNIGMKKTFVRSFTGDVAIGSGSGNANSLFGNEIPIVSDFDTIEPLVEFEQAEKLLDSIVEVDSYTAIVSVASGMTIDGINKAIALFGIEPETYFKVCPDISIVSGNINSLSNKGVFINSVLADELESALNRPLEIGESVTFTLYSHNSFRIRSAPLLGIHTYSGSTEALNRVVLSDLATVRSMANYTMGFTNPGSEKELFESDVDAFNFEDLFTDDNDLSSASEDMFNLQDFEKSLADTADRDTLVMTDKGAWSFILIKAAEGKSREVITKLRKILKENYLSVDLLSWRRAAGTTALLIFALQSVFYMGIGFLGIGAVLVIMNALVISVLERSSEIGTMRSMGASSGFIRSLFMIESLIITIGGAVLGIIIGATVVFFIKSTDVHLTNTLLISLFGGATLNPIISLKSVLFHLMISLIVGSLSWIYPVALAMKIQPVMAMNKG